MPSEVVPPRPIRITAEKFGSTHKEGIPFTEYFLKIPQSAALDRDITLQTLVWERHSDSEAAAEHAAFVKDMQKQPSTSSEQGMLSLLGSESDAVMLSGGLTTALDWSGAVPFNVGQFFPRIALLSHPEAPGSQIKPKDMPLNSESFANSGYIILRAVEQVIQKGELKPGLTAIAHSAGSAVFMEAIARDIQEAEATGRERYLKQLVLIAPAGIIDMKDAERLTTGAMKTLGPLMGDYVSALGLGKQREPKRARQILKSFAETLSNLPQAFSTLATNLRETYKDPFLRQQILEAWNNPEWKTIRLPHVIFEVIQNFARRFPSLEGALAFFHFQWPDQSPHFTPETPGFKHNLELLSRNCTESARAAIKDTPMAVVLFDGDTAVPPEGFLKPEDRAQLAKLSRSLTKEEMSRKRAEVARRIEQNIRSTFVAENETRVQKHQEPLVGSVLSKRLARMHITKEAELRQDILAEAKADLIFQRIKEAFPQNQENVRVLLGIYSHHNSHKSHPDFFLVEALQKLSRAGKKLAVSEY